MTDVRRTLNWPPPVMTRWLSDGQTVNLRDLIAEMREWTEHFSNPDPYRPMVEVGGEPGGLDEVDVAGLNVSLDAAPDPYVEPINIVFNPALLDTTLGSTTESNTGWPESIAMPEPVGVPHACPVCRGTGLVSRPPHVAGDLQTWTTTSCGPWQCRPCTGTGILWSGQ